MSGGTPLIMELLTVLGVVLGLGEGPLFCPSDALIFFFFSLDILFFAGVWRPLWLTDFSPGLTVIRTHSALTYTKYEKNPVLHAVQTTRP